jgi:predicted alpha-1,6-mannanase (GH76 family)
VGFECSVVPPLGGGGDVFFDDNTWLALALICHYDIRQDDSPLSLAGRLFEFVTSGWSSEDSWSHPGGIRWKQPLSNTSRNTCSNGPVVELGALLYERTGDAGPLEWSIRIYDWVRSTLLGPDELYVDQIAPDGTLLNDIWSYNQGTMIGAGVLLHRVTGESGYLTHATATASASVSRFIGGCTSRRLL